MSDKVYQLFDNFNARFQGDIKSLDCGHICSGCAHNCEVENEGEKTDFKYILAFLPGELEYVSDKMNIPVKEFKDKYAYGIDTGDRIIECMRFSGQCSFLGKNFECLMGETKIISCKIYPLIHYPLVEYAVSTHCDLTKHPDVMKQFEQGLEGYKELIRLMGLDQEYLYYRQCFDILQLDAEKSRQLLESDHYEVVPIDTLKKWFLARPDLI